MLLPLVSVVVVNFNGRHHLQPCFQSLIEQDYPSDRLELILIDNASIDGSLALMAEQFPQVQVVCNSTNIGFAPAVNQGASLATGHYLALINTATRLEASWVRTMVATIEAGRDRRVACVGSQILDWDGQKAPAFRQARHS